jgi:hypothetical protein
MAIHAYLLNTVDHFEERLNKLAADSERQFGTLDSTNMLRHMRKSIESAVGVGAEDVQDISKPIVRTVVFFIVTRVIKQWPGGKIKAPRYWTPIAEGDFNEELALIKASAKAYLEALGLHRMIGMCILFLVRLVFGSGGFCWGRIYIII